MSTPSLTPLLSAARSWDPTVGSTQVGFRAISGEIASSGERVSLRAWALVYPHCLVADSYYDLLVSLLAEVDRSGTIALPIEGISGSTFANMSERHDLLGERGTIWITAADQDAGERGAVLAAVNNAMVYLLTLYPYLATGNERPARLLEEIALRMAERTADLRLSPAADTMSRLPVLQDLDSLLGNPRVEANWYRVTGN